MHPPWVYTCSHPEPPSHLPPHTTPLGHPSAPAPSLLYLKGIASYVFRVTPWSYPHAVVNVGIIDQSGKNSVSTVQLLSPVRLFVTP